MYCYDLGWENNTVTIRNNFFLKFNRKSDKIWKLCQTLFVGISNQWKAEEIPALWQWCENVTFGYVTFKVIHSGYLHASFSIYNINKIAILNIDYSLASGKCTFASFLQRNSCNHIEIRATQPFTQSFTQYEIFIHVRSIL